MTQKGTYGPRSQPVNVRARVTNIPNESESICLDIYESDPMQADVDGYISLGLWFTNRRDAVAYANSYRDDMDLKQTGNDEYLGEGKYFGVRRIDTSEVIASCLITVREIGDHADPSEEPEDDEEEEGEDEEE
jgi:hypothetical protein